jgi:hypothetical protein
MGIKGKGLAPHADYNREFLNLASVIIDDVFQTESEGPIGYVNARPPQKDDLDWRPNYRSELIQKAQAPPPGHEKAFALEELGDYERLVVSALAWGQYSTYVLVGEMGSGKTATTKYVVERLRRTRADVCLKCKQCSPVILYLNFNEGFNQDSSESIIDNFKLRLYESMRRNMRDFFSEHGLTDRFLDVVEKNRTIQIYDAFDGFLQQREEDKEWWQHAERVKANKLISFLEMSVTEPGSRLERIMALVRFCKDNLLPGPGCFTLVFDNIDSVLVEAQFDLLREILTAQDIAKVKSLVVLRYATFQKLNTRAAYSFGVIRHRGPGVLEILRRRLKHYEDNWHNLSLIKYIGDQYAEPLRRRLKYLASTLSEAHSPVERATLLTGTSARLGLYSTERSFKNVSLPFDQDPQNKDEMFKAILVGMNEAGELDHSDRCFVNLFLDLESKELSLLSLRIIQIIVALEKEVQPKNLGHVSEIIVNIEPCWKEEAIRKSINYLLSIRRPLIWVDGRSEYRTVEDLDGDEMLFLTEAGRAYFERGIRDLVYVQESLTSLFWPNEGDYLPQDIENSYSSALDRFRILRSLLQAVKDHDSQQIIRLDAWISADKRRFYARGIGSALCLILEGVGRSVLNILRPTGGADHHEIREELSGWLSLILEAASIDATRWQSTRSIKRETSGLERLVKQLEISIDTAGQYNRANF